MTTQRNPLRWAFGILAAACATVALVVPLAPSAHADPQADAVAAIDQAWVSAGGDTSPLGPRVDGVYPAGVGFAQNFVNGAMFYTPETGAHSVLGAILEKYRAEGGPEGDLGFPNIDEGPGRAPESRNVTFNGADSPVIFWTPQTGAWVVRGVINAAWDRLGGSSGSLGVPVEDETYAGETISQRFTDGELSYDTATRTFTSSPPELAGQLADLPLPDDAATAIDLAWRVAGGPGGQLGAKDGAQYPVGDGAGQNFAGGKIFFSPATGAHVVSGTILDKYEEAGGPTGELGFPTANEVDGDVPGSRVSTFGAEDSAAIVWTPEHGAIIVRGAMKAAWDELGGSGGDLGVPVADQTGDDGTITQNFSGGQVTWNSANNTFSTQPPELAEQLTGLEVPGQTAPSPTAAPPATAAADDGDADSSGFVWRSWYLWVLIPVAVLVVASLLALLVTRQRRNRRSEYLPPSVPPAGRDEYDEDDYEADDDFATPSHFSADEGTPHDWTGSDPGRGGPTFGATEPDDTDYLASQPPWANREAGARPWSGAASTAGGLAAAASGPELFTHHGAHEAEAFTADIDDSDPADESDTDDVDTAPTRVQTNDEQSGRHAAVTDESPSRWSVEDEPDVPGPNSLFAPVYGAAPPPSASTMDDDAADEPDESVEALDDYSQSYSDDHAEGYSEGYAEPEYGRAEYSPESSTFEPSAFEPSAFEPSPSEPEAETAPPPAIHLPLDDPDEAPEGYPVKGSMRTGTYHTPDSGSYDVTVAEIWFASAELAEANGFTRAE
ncbi:hypothetical protein BH11ACT7_BH11ACT7_16460 [soil metagenome]